MKTRSSDKNSIRSKNAAKPKLTDRESPKIKIKLKNKKLDRKFMAALMTERLRKMCEIRNLPDYEEIKKFLNTPSLTTKSSTTSNNNKKRGNDKTASTTYFWNTSIYLVHEIEKCIMQNDWTNVTRLLMSLADAPKRYQPFLLKAMLINFACNPVADEGDLRDFLVQCYSCQTDQDIQTTLTSIFHSFS